MQFRFASAFLGLSLALAHTPQNTADWQKVDNPPNVDFSPLTLAQKKTALAPPCARSPACAGAPCGWPIAA